MLTYIFMHRLTKKLNQVCLNFFKKKKEKHNNAGFHQCLTKHLVQLAVQLRVRASRRASLLSSELAAMFSACIPAEARGWRCCLCLHTSAAVWGEKKAQAFGITLKTLALSLQWCLHSGWAGEHVTARYSTSTPAARWTSKLQTISVWVPPIIEGFPLSQ